MQTYSSTRALTALLMLTFALTVSDALAADQYETAGPYSPAAQADVRYDGVLAESYQYHRQEAPAAYTSSCGWYGYGFPVSSYRWGWFGAERYYPRVIWHRDYHGDCVRWAYRYGY